jgi:hypothetical protein
MSNVKDTYLKAHLSDMSERVANADARAAEANERAATNEREAQGLRARADEAELELARLTGPPYYVPVSKDGIAVPDLSKGDKQFILLTRPTRIILPTLDKGKSLSWTLILREDGIGQHHFTTSPNVMPAEDLILNSPPYSSWVLTFVTDDNGTIDTTFGGAKPIPAPNPQTEQKAKDKSNRSTKP